MNRVLLLCSAMLLLVTAGCAEQDAPPPETESPKSKMDKFEPQISRYFKVPGKAGNTGMVRAASRNISQMGVYVYDKYGNCVAWGDEANFHAGEVMEVKWLLQEDGNKYTVEVRNNGMMANECVVVVLAGEGEAEGAGAGENPTGKKAAKAPKK